ncbi:PhnA-like protein [Lichenibacterium dinghuense]|uniref:PhnA-like protein n=1 Tax=Lichenibacterium dinghuense TaxID=2895977 RepID=UPI001F3D46D0|nr:PhnA-like protein [Lichenibacterium sp. 6Y81]
MSAADDARTILVNNVSWGGVLAGVVAGLVTQLILNMIGIGIGASTLNPTTGDNPSASGFSIGAGLWWAVSGIVAAFVGGYIASRLSGRPKASTGGWHGLISWALTTLLIVYLLTTAVGGLIGGAFNTVSGAIGGVGHAVSSAAQTAVPPLTQGTDPVGAMQQALSSPAANDPADFKGTTASFAKALVTGDDAQVADAREKVAQALSKSQSVPIDQARSRVASTEQQIRDRAAQAKQQTAEAAAAAKGVSRGALLASLALVLSAIASWFGGRAGSRSDRGGGAVHPYRACPGHPGRVTAIAHPATSRAGELSPSMSTTALGSFGSDPAPIGPPATFGRDDEATAASTPSRLTSCSALSPSPCLSPWRSSPRRRSPAWQTSVRACAPEARRSVRRMP